MATEVVAVFFGAGCVWGVCFEWWREIKAKTASFFHLLNSVGGREGVVVWGFFDLLRWGIFWCRNGDFECEWAFFWCVWLGGGGEWLRFVGLFLWTGWIFVGLFRGGIWAGLIKS